MTDRHGSKVIVGSYVYLVHGDNGMGFDVLKQVLGSLAIGAVTAAIHHLKPRSKGSS